MRSKSFLAAWYGIALALLIAGCTTVFQRADGTYDVPRAIEERSFFGTNAGFVKIEHCLTKVSKITWTNPLGLPDYIDCHPQKDWQMTQSQGPGGPIIAGGLIGLGLGLGNAFGPGGGNAASSSSANSNATLSIRGHR